MTSSSAGSTGGVWLDFYVQTVFGILGQPRLFFANGTLNVSLMRALFFLATSALFSSAASLLTTRQDQFFLMGGIYLLNAIGMVLIMAALAYMVMILTIGKKAPFAGLFGIYALCSGVTLLVSWIPYFVVFTEPWRWYLIGVGLKKCCGLKLREVVIIIGLSLIIWILFFWSLIPILTP